MSAIAIRPLEQSDHADWQRLWSDYMAFYETSMPNEVRAATWRRLFEEGDFEPRGFVALIDGEAVGFVHCLFHRSTWSVEGNCYLQDLFTAPHARGKGAGEALIGAVRKLAAERGVASVYWMTHETNVTARKLYDRVARRTGFIEYAVSR